MCENWRYQRLADYTYKESMGEMKHAHAVIDRMLYCESAPNMQPYMKITVGKTVPEQLHQIKEIGADNYLAQQIDGA